MRKVRRTTPPPLFFEVVKEPRERLLSWAHRREDERRQRRAPIDHDLFHGSHLSDLVYSDFEGACAFCERPVSLSEGVGHFRPLNVFGEIDQSDEAYHYSWLAYEWLNLFLICRRCEKLRKDRFPVTGRRAQFLSTFDEVQIHEKPLLVDPTSDNPAKHLLFLTTGECLPNKNSAKGKATIDLFDLNDGTLISERAEVIEEVVKSWKTAVEGRIELSGEMFTRPFQGAWREILVRLLGYSGAGIRTVSGDDLAHRLQGFLTNSNSYDRGLMIETIDLVLLTDQLKRSELKPRQPAPKKGDSLVADLPPTRKLLSPRGEVSHFRIANYKAIGELSLGIGEERHRKSGSACLLLLGENAVGKSTCLSAIALALLGVKESRKLHLRRNELARSSSRDTWNVWERLPIEVQLSLDDRRSSVEFFYDPVREIISGTEEQSAVVLGYGPHRFFAPSRGRRGMSAAYGVQSLFKVGHALPDPSAWLKDLRGHAFDEVVRTVRKILPVGDDDQLVNDSLSGICVYAQGQLTPVSQLSEGYRSVFAMVVDICRTLLDHWSNLETASAVVLIDEIETHLHPRWKMRVMSSLREAFPRVQFIATTHDPLCLRGMEDGEVVVLARDSDGGIVALKDLPSISGMRVEQLLTSDYFGLSSTVDPGVQLEIAKLAQGVAIDPTRAIGKEAERLVARLTVGDSAGAQIIQEALLRYLLEREQPTDALPATARADAVDAVFQALRRSRAG